MSLFSRCNKPAQTPLLSSHTLRYSVPLRGGKLRGTISIGNKAGRRGIGIDFEVRSPY
jgi:hypothetical protein